MKKVIVFACAGIMVLLLYFGLVRQRKMKRIAIIITLFFFCTYCIGQKPKIKSHEILKGPTEFVSIRADIDTLEVPAVFLKKKIKKKYPAHYKDGILAVSLPIIKMDVKKNHSDVCNQIILIPISQK